MSLRKFLLFLTLPLFSCICFAQESMTLEQAINIALEKNTDIKKQRYALAQAEGQYRAVKGKTDIEIGTEAKYQIRNTPVDPQDPHYAYTYSFYNEDSKNGIYLDNTINRQTTGSVYIKKLFSFGLESKLSYSIRRNNDTPEYTYSKDYNLNRYKQEKGRNTGELSLELTLPLFKSFQNSITHMQMESAKAQIEQMRYQLQDAMAKTVLETSKAYWQYYCACENHKQLLGLGKKIQQRYENMKELHSSGVRSKANLLTIQVNKMENEREIENAMVRKTDAKMKLLQVMGFDRDEELGEPSLASVKPYLYDGAYPTPEMITDEFVDSITEHRNDFLAMKKKIASADMKVSSSKLDRLPDANLNLNVGTTGNKYSDSPVDFADSGFWNIQGANIGGGLGLSMKLGNNEKRGASQQAVAEYDDAINEYNRARTELTTQLVNSVRNLQAYRKNVETADEVLALQNSLYENQEVLFTSGFINADTLIEQDQKNLDAKSAYNQVLIDFMTGVLQYKYLTASMLTVDASIEYEEKEWNYPTEEQDMMLDQ